MNGLAVAAIAWLLFAPVFAVVIGTWLQACREAAEAQAAHQARTYGDRP